MKLRITFLALGLLAVFVSTAQPGKQASVLPFEYVPNRLLLKFRDSALPVGWQNGKIVNAHPLLAQINPSRAQVMDLIDVIVLDFDRPVSVPNLVRFVAGHPDVEFAEPDGIARIAWTPNDPNFLNTNQYGPRKIDAEPAWDVWRGDNNFIIAILDTGVQSNHSDLNGKFVAGYNYVANNTNAEDDHGHGTHVAGIASANTNNGVLMAGICPMGKIMSVKVCNSSGSCSWTGMASGVTFAMNNGAHVINMSIAGSSGSATLASALTLAHNNGVLTIAAAGNSGSSSSNFYPANYPEVIAVAASNNTPTNNKWQWSNYGNWVDVAAPGENIFSTWRFDSTNWLSGTSMASPHVAGAALLLYSKLVELPAQRSMATANRVRQLLETTTDPVNDTLLGSYVRTGKINLNRALRSILLDGDINGDGCVDDVDLAIVVERFGQTGPDRADRNSDGVVDDTDLAIVVSQFGQGC